jgi:phosphoribosylformimino-5-aminoimidazole carboxamide ribotide isomerase
MVATDGWEKTSSVSAIDLARSFAGVPLAALLYTDVARDGTRSGPNVEATARLARDSGFAVIASGGIGSLYDLRSLAGHAGIESAIVGRALYDGAFTLDEAIAAAANG